MTFSSSPIEDTSKPFHLKYRLHQDRLFCSAIGEREFRPIPPLGMPAIRASDKSKETLEHRSRG